MTSPYLAEMFAELHAAELRREARSARLVAIARCCRPSAWARTARRASAAVARMRTAIRNDPQHSAAPCCAAA